MITTVRLCYEQAWMCVTYTAWTIRDRTSKQPDILCRESGLPTLCGSEWKNVIWLIFIRYCLQSPTWSTVLNLALFPAVCTCAEVLNTHFVLVSSSLGIENKVKKKCFSPETFTKILKVYTRTRVVMLRLSFTSVQKSSDFTSAQKSLQGVRLTTLLYQQHLSD